MEDTQKQDKLPPIKYTKRVGHLFEHVRDIDNLKEAIKDAARHKRKRKEVQKVLEDIDGHALELQRMLDEETFIPAKYTMRRINDGIQKKTNEKEEREERQKQLDEREQIREKNELCIINSVNAAIALGEATARAVQRIPDAHCNGDMHAALDYAQKVKHEQKNFLNEQALKHIIEEGEQTS